MFWKKKKKTKPKGRDAVVAQAKKIAAGKREEIGDETLEKIREAMMKNENSPMRQALKKIEGMDQDKLRDNLKYMMRDKE